MSSEIRFVFDYLIIIDLETTCDDLSDPNRQEIVELPWLVYELRSRTAVDHKQIFISPQWNTNPNPPQQAVRGLGTDVAFSPSLKDAILQFDNYLYQSFVVHGKTFCLLTDGPWDLQHLLLLEAARKAIILAPHFRRFFNLRAEYSRCYPGAHPPSDRQTMVNALNIPLDQSNTGIDDCIALAAIVSRMLFNGHNFTTPDVIPDYEWNAAAMRIPAVAAPVASAVPVGGIVRLRGLPWACTEQDIVQFLMGIRIVPAGIHFVRNSHGKATGEAFVQLETEEGVKMALARNRQSMGRRYIEVFKSSPPDMSNHLGRADARRVMHQQHQAHAHVHKAAAAAAVAAADSGKVSGQGYARNGAGGSRHGDSKGTGFAGSNKLGKGGRNGRGSDAYVESHLGELKNSMGIGSYSQHSSAAAEKAAYATGSATGTSYVLRVLGVPQDCVADDLLSVFDGIEMVGDGIHLLPKRDGIGEHTGEAFVEFTSETWAKKALERNGARLKSSTVEVRRSSMGQMKSAFENAGAAHVLPERAKRIGSSTRSAQDASYSAGNGSRENGYSEGKRNGKSYFLQASIPDKSVTTESIAKLFEGLNVSESDVAISSEGSAAVSAEDGAAAKSRVAKVAFYSRSARDSALSNARNGAHGNYKWESAGESVHESSSSVSGGKTSTCVVRMRGLPYTSNEDDIRRFFQGYAIAQGGISRGKDRQGRPSGEAWVTFLSSGEAQQAVSKLDKAHMGTRYIELLMSR